MNRLAPLIVRHPPRRMHGPARYAEEELVPALPDRMDDLRLFAMGWVAGLVFFGTLLA